MGLSVLCNDRTLSIYRKSTGTLLLTQQAAPDSRPFIHPITAPDEAGVLTENAPEHHPWQHGLYVGLNDVNGIGFWEEGLRGNPLDGTFHPDPLKEPVQSEQNVQWEVDSAWRDPHGSNLLREKQLWTFSDLGDAYLLDLEWTLTAESDLTFGHHSYGGLFLRMPYRHERGGSCLNSEGQSGGDAEAQRARWTAVSMLTDGRTNPAGIAIMDHPENPEYPVPWRVDGQLGIAPSRCIAGEWKLGEGNSARFTHRLFIFCGESDAERIEACWRKFAANAF